MPRLRAPERAARHAHGGGAVTAAVEKQHWWTRVASTSSPRVLDIACVVALVALVLIAWSMFDPAPVPVILAMSVAQVLGTMSFAAFLVVVVRDLRRAQTNETNAAKVSSEPGSRAAHQDPAAPTAP
jgi:hypothetical protein